MRLRMTTKIRSVRVTCALVCCISLSWFAPGLSVAQVLPGNVLPEALKDIKPAGGACARDNVGARASTQTRLDVPVADLSCAITAPEALSLLGRPESVVVDTRPATEFGGFQIEGSLNLTVSGLRHKSYLRDKTIVLVGSGKGEHVLYEACAELKKDGFKQVRVLRGGLIAWLSYAQPSIGRAPGENTLAQLSPAELWLESQFGANLVLVNKKQDAIQSLIPYGVLIAQDSKEAIKTILERRQKGIKNELNKAWKENSLASVVLVTARGTSSEQIVDLRKSLRPVPLLVYSDTAENFNSYIATQKAIWAAQAHGPKQPKCGL